MWLINVKTFELQSFLHHNVWEQSPYAILSHTWEREEVTFQDMQNLHAARKKAGFWKIGETCEQDQRANLE